MHVLISFLISENLPEAFRIVCASEAIEDTLLTLLETLRMRSLMQLEEHQPQIAHVVGCAMLLAGCS
jgi:hypothetical protein